MSVAATSPVKWKGKLIMTGLAVIALVVLWKLLPVAEWSRNFIEYVDSVGVWAPLVFAPIYVLAAMVGIPRTALNVGAGILFSYPVALLVVLVSAAITYVATFTIARHWAREWVEKRISKIPIAQDIMRAVEKEGFKLVFLVRLNPFIPGVIKGYGFGTTSIPLKTYLPASLLGFLPIACAHVYLGWLGGMSMTHADQQPDAMKMWMMIGGAVVSLALVIFVSWFGHRAVKKHTQTTD